MKKAIVLALILILGIYSGKTQGIGLSGKRISVFYDFDYSGAFAAFIIFGEVDGNYYNVLNDKKPSNIKTLTNIQHTFRVDYALLRNISIGGLAAYSRDAYEIIEPALFTRNYQVFSYGITLKDFFLKRGGIAPLGNYMGMKFVLNTVNAHNRGNPKLYGDNYREHEFSFHFPTIGFSLGRQGVLANKLLYNVSFEVGMNIYMLGNFEDPWPSAHIPGAPLLGNLPPILNTLNRNNQFRLTFGVGIAP